MKYLKLFNESSEFTRSDVDDIKDMFLSIADEYNLVYIYDKD
jgi:hypothetical protein